MNSLRFCSVSQKLSTPCHQTSFTYKTSHLDIEDTVDKFDLRQHVITSVECLGGAWNGDDGEWTVQFRDLQTGLEFKRHATVFVSAVGAISFPRDVRFKGMEQFKGDMFHTARWDHSVDYTGKRVVGRCILSPTILTRFIR